MLKRKISFVTYTIIITALILVVGISCLLVIQNNLMKDDMNLMAYKKLTQEVAQIRRYIVYDSQKKPHIDDGFYDREDDPDSNEQIYVFLQGNDGEILDGEVPEEYADNPDISIRDLMHIDAGKVKYFAVVRQGRTDKEPLKKTSKYKICVMVSVRDIESNYSELLYKSYCVIGIVLIAFVIYAFALRKLIAVPMGSLNRSIDKSVDNLDFTENLEYDGPFKELDMLTDANNNLYRKVHQELERQAEFNANVSHELRTPVAQSCMPSVSFPGRSRRRMAMRRCLRA